MTTEQLAAMPQALEAWQTSVYGSESHHKAMLIAMTNMAQAIEQAETAQGQEPVGYLYSWIHSSATGRPDETYTSFAETLDQAKRHESNFNVRPIYTTPPATQPVLKPLTDEEIVAINDKHYNIAYRDFDADIAIARAIEAAHGIKGDA